MSHIILTSYPIGLDLSLCAGTAYITAEERRSVNLTYPRSTSFGLPNALLSCTSILKA